MAGIRYERSNEAGVAFLMADLDTALTFMDVAQVSRNLETVARNHENARIAYRTVLRIIKKLKPDALQLQTIHEKLRLLKSRLEAAGYRL